MKAARYPQSILPPISGTPRMSKMWDALVLSAAWLLMNPLLYAGLGVWIILWMIYWFSVYHEEGLNEIELRNQSYLCVVALQGFLFMFYWWLAKKSPRCWNRLVIAFIIVMLWLIAYFFWTGLWAFLIHVDP